MGPHHRQCFNGNGGYCNLFAMRVQQLYSMNSTFSVFILICKPP
jgi:hypothetical protein